MLRRILLACGIAASALYVAIDVVAAIRYPGYHSFTSRALSELMARGAPTERLVDPPLLLYDVLMLAFAVGLSMSGRGKNVQVTAVSLIAYATIGFLGPTLFEMDVRSAAGPTRADALHIALTGVMVLLILASVVAGSTIGGRRFRRYSIATLFVIIAFGALTSLAARGATPAETPWLGVVERICVGGFLLWIAVLAISLLLPRGSTDRSAPAAPGLPSSPQPAR